MMRQKWVIARILTLLATLLLSSAAKAQSLFDVAQKQGKEVENPFPLTPEHGPIMVRVASFTGFDGQQCAIALAKELREQKAKYDACVYRFQAKLPGQENMPTKEDLDRFEAVYKVRPRVPKFKTEPEVNWVVLVGNFKSMDDKEATKTRDRIRKFEPKSIDASVWNKTLFFVEKGAKMDNDGDSPLRGASLAPNPIAPKKHVARIGEEKAKLLLAMNDDLEHSVYQISEPYTLCVIQLRGIDVLEEKKDIFEGKFFKGNQETPLQKAATNAILLTQRLRDMGIPAYVFHGEFASLVCVGGFQGRQDPRLYDAMNRLSKVSLGEINLKPELIATPRRPSL